MMMYDDDEYEEDDDGQMRKKGVWCGVVWRDIINKKTMHLRILRWEQSSIPRFPPILLEDVNTKTMIHDAP